MAGWLDKNGDRYTLGVDRVLQHSPAKVWRALTERDLLRQWFPCDIEGRFEVGAPLRFTFRNGEGDGLPEHVMRGEVLAVETERLLAIRWGDHRIRMQLTPTEGGCRFVLTDTFDDPSISARSAAGWEDCLDNLVRVADGGDPRGFAWERWQPVFDEYARRFEPEFGPQQGAPADFDPTAGG